MWLRENASALCKQEWNVPSLSSKDTSPRFFQVLPSAFELRISPFILIDTSLHDNFGWHFHEVSTPTGQLRCLVIMQKHDHYNIFGLSDCAEHLTGFLCVQACSSGVSNNVGP
jgi:hypothetical protein